MKKDIKDIFSNNLVKLMDKRGETLTDLSNSIGVSFSTVSDWRHGKKMARSGGLQKIAEHYNVNVSFLTTDHNDTVVNRQGRYIHFDTAIPAGAISDVGTFLDDEFDWITLSDEILGKYAGRSDIFVTHVNGESMNNTIPDKSMIAVKQVSDAFELEDGDIVVFRNGAGMSVKRLYNDKNEQRLVFRPDSSDKTFTDHVVTYDEASELEIYGKVITYVVNL